MFLSKYLCLAIHKNLAQLNTYCTEGGNVDSTVQLSITFCTARPNKHASKQPVKQRRANIILDFRG